MLDVKREGNRKYIVREFGPRTTRSFVGSNDVLDRCRYKEELLL